MPEQQAAVWLEEVGKPVRLGSRHIPSPIGSQVLIRVTSVMLLPHDAYAREFGLFVGEKLPWVLGINIAGQVVQAGTLVQSVKVGDHVFGLGDLSGPIPDQGGLQEFCLMNEDAITTVPEGFTDDEVATLPVNAVTSFIALFTGFGFDFPAPWTTKGRALGLGSESIVILAAGSNAGKLAVQFAKMAGIGLIICVAGLNNTAELESFGATHVIDRHLSQEEIVSRIHGITGKDNATRVYDCYSFEYDLALDILPSTIPSTLVTLHTIRGAEADKVKIRRPLVEAGIVPCSNKNLAPYVEDFWKHLVVGLQKGTLRPTAFQVIEGLDVDQINTALDLYASAKPQKQVVVHPSNGKQ
ncbi:hypothetical protein LTR17_014945 [Elasticomyces elasticus]|nr:hypothetical protein LTR17_014945 [Elasticomyces elasticus]